MIYEVIEVIDKNCFNKSKLLPEEFLQECKNNYNEPQLIPKDTNKDIQYRSLKQFVFAQVKYIISNKFEDKERKCYKPKYMYKFEVKYYENESYFDIDFDWIENNFNTREQYFYKRLLKTYVSRKSDTEAPIISFLIGSSKNSTQPKFHPHAPTVKYQQIENNSSLFSILSYAPFAVN